MKKVLMLVLLGVLASSASAQSHTIKGSERPDLITDSQAYGLFFSHYSEMLANPKITDVQKARMFQMVGLSAKDESNLRDLLNDHKARRDAQLALFNKKATEMYQRGDSIPSFEQIHQFIISETKGKLAASLSTDGLKKLDAHIQGEKSKMIVPATE